MNDMVIPSEKYEQAVKIAAAMREQIGRAFVGQTEVVDQVLAALFAAGHVLIEGVPGLGKTLLVRALARTFDGKFGRIQFTADLMPSDITGAPIFDMKQQEFKFRPGPVFTQLLLADEINRSPANEPLKQQSCATSSSGRGDSFDCIANGSRRRCAIWSMRWIWMTTSDDCRSLPMHWKTPVVTMNTFSITAEMHDWPMCRAAGRWCWRQAGAAASQTMRRIL